MKTTIQHYFLTFGFWLLAFGLQAQDYEWDWAKNGGGINQYSVEIQGNISNLYAEMIWDIAIDEDNNYYFLASLSTGDTHVDGNSVINYALPTQNTGSDILIFSTECNGTFRWSRTIGGSSIDNAYHLTLDNNGGIYINVYVANTYSPDIPVHFSEDDIMPYVEPGTQEQEGRKRGFLLKYDTDNGDLIWRKDYQGNVSSLDLQWWMDIGGGVQIDSNNILHTVVGFKHGVHLDGQLTVELNEDEDFKYYLLKLDSTTGNLIGTPLLLPMGGGEPQYMSFRYDETLNRYYIAGSKIYGSLGGTMDMFFNDVTFGEQNTGFSYCFLISFNPNDLQDWWYKEIVLTGGSNQSYINGIEIDSNSDIYIAGAYLNLDGLYTASFGEHTFSTSTGTISYVGDRPFILKMNPQGEVQWSKTPDSQSTVNGGQTLPNSYDLAVNGDEVALATVVGITQWGDFSINRPNGHGLDPALIRFDKQTGEVIGLHDIMGNAAGDYHMTAVTADQDGNYVVGGAMRWSLFTDSPNGITPLMNTGSTNYYTDFFFARLANSVCGSGNVSTEMFKQQTLRLYPNPTNGLVYIEVPEGIQSYEVYNLVGQRLMSGNSNGNINLQELSQGTYIIKVRTQSGEVMTGKVIKQ